MYFSWKTEYFKFYCINSCNFISFICKSLNLQPWSLSLASVAPIPYKENKPQVVQFITSSNEEKKLKKQS